MSAAALPAVPARPLARIGGEARQAEDLRPAEKAAIVLAALGPALAAPVLQALGEANIHRFARTIANMGLIPGPVLEAVIGEFLGELGGAEDLNGGLATARRLLSGALDRDACARIMEDLQGTASLSVWERLGSAPVGALANFLACEHPQVGAVVLGRMRADRAARVLERLPAAGAQTIVLRMSRMPRLEPSVLEELKTILEEEFLSVIQREQASKRPAELLAALMNNVSGASRDQFLADLEAADAPFAAEVQRVMFTFGDILARLSPRDVTQITRAVEEEVLLTALKTGLETHPKVVEFLLANLAKRLSERIGEDLAAMQPVPLKEGEAAQMEIVKAIQALAQRGEIKLIQPEAPEED